MSVAYNCSNDARNMTLSQWLLQAGEKNIKYGLFLWAADSLVGESMPYYMQLLKILGSNLHAIQQPLYHCYFRIICNISKLVKTYNATLNKSD